MARKKFLYPPAPPSGSQTFSDNIVGLQIVAGGGLTQGNFEFTSAIYEKVNRKFDTGIFSEPYTLENLQIENIEEINDMFSFIEKYNPELLHIFSLPFFTFTHIFNIHSHTLIIYILYVIYI
jgi:hypothetical protein